MLLGVDVGGTFTDAVLVDEDGALLTAKVRSTKQDQSVGVLRAVEAVLGQQQRLQVRRFAHGMTVATNALLEGTSARTALLVTEGFTDLIELRRQARPDLYRLCSSPPAPLVPRELRFGVKERMTPEGVEQALSEHDAEALIEALNEADVEAAAIVLLHSYAHPEHELLLGGLLAKRLPDVHVSLSHDLVGTFREYERAATTELDAALSPLLGSYLRKLSGRAASASLPEPEIMQSSGGLIDAERAASHAALTVLSGPAGGVNGALLLASLAGEQDLLCLDMGGTSCDVCLVRGGVVSETGSREIAGRPLALPCLDIHTVGAGGGSIAWRDNGGALRVGPRSAGADPGPACYQLGGREPTVTDANLLLGRIPQGIPLAGGLELEVEAAETAIRSLATSLDLGVLECAEGIVKIAELEMLRALQVMSVQRGVDPRTLALLGFGGAGPLHAASLASQLGIRKVLCPRASGVLCALGLAAAAPRYDVVKTVMLTGGELRQGRLQQERDALVARAEAELQRSSTAGNASSVRVTAAMRYGGQSFELDLDASEMLGPDELIEAFAAEHERRYGYRNEEAEVELVTLRISAFGDPPVVRLHSVQGDAPLAESRGSVVYEGREQEARLLLGGLPQGAAVKGPAICALSEATIFVPPGWSGEVDAYGTLVLESQQEAIR